MYKKELQPKAGSNSPSCCFLGVRMTNIYDAACRRVAQLYAHKITISVTSDRSIGIFIDFPIEIIDEKLQCFTDKNSHGVVGSIFHYTTRVCHYIRINSSDCCSIFCHHMNSFSTSIYGFVTTSLSASARNCQPDWLTSVNMSDIEEFKNASNS